MDVLVALIGLYTLCGSSQSQLTDIYLRLVENYSCSRYVEFVDRAG